MSFPLTLDPRRPEPGAFARVLRRSRRWATFAVLLAMLTVLVPDSGQLPARFSLIKLDQVHGMDADPNFVEGGDLDAAQALVDATEHAELFLYPGDVHLFADSSLPSYDRKATELMTGRILDFLSALARVQLSPSVS